MANGCTKNCMWGICRVAKYMLSNKIICICHVYYNNYQVQYSDKDPAGISHRSGTTSTTKAKELRSTSYSLILSLWDCGRTTRMYNCPGSKPPWPTRMPTGWSSCPTTHPTVSAIMARLTSPSKTRQGSWKFILFWNKELKFIFIRLN